MPVVGDVADWDSHERAADAAADRAPLRAWVNNAGVAIGGAAHEVDAAAIDAAIARAPGRGDGGTAVAVRRMLALPADDRGERGAIVNVSSIQGVAAFPSFYAYGAAKAAIIALARSVAVDHGHHGIRCNTVLPGTIETPMMHRGLGGRVDDRGRTTRRGRARAPGPRRRGERRSLAWSRSCSPPARAT